MLKTPVAFVIFNRPEYASRVFEQFRKAKPTLLLVIADGPRESHPTDQKQCALSRAIIDQVDWDCEVRKCYSDVNLGCGRRVSSGLTWIFEQVEEAIILEDDCIPDLTFFQFCEELLERYRRDQRVSQIGGVNYQFGKGKRDYSYYFSQYHYVWGWATWRRAWKGYDFKVKLWPELRDQGRLRDLFGDKGVVRYYTMNLDQTYRGDIDTWDFQWFFHCWINHRLSVLPSVNLVSNIGYHQVHATHTKMGSPMSDVSMEPMAFPLSHPPFMVRDLIADKYNGALFRLSSLSHLYLKMLYLKQKITEKLKRSACGMGER